jgi:hypothetical protein
VTGIFKANNPYNNFLLLVYGLLLKLPFFLEPVKPEPAPTDGKLFHTLLHTLSGAGDRFPVIYPFTCFLLLYTQALTFNRIANEQRLLPKPNYLIAMSYLLITSLFREWNILSAPLLVNTLLIAVWGSMSNLHQVKKPMPALFNIGIIIGITTSIYPPSIAFVALVIFGLLFTRAFHPAEWLVALLGIICPYYFFAAYAYLTNQLRLFRFPRPAISLPTFYQTNWAAAAIIIVLLAASIGILFIRKYYFRQLVQTRKSWNLLFLYLLVALFVPFINTSSSFSYWILSAIPFSAFMGSSFFYPERPIVPLFFHWLIVAFVLAFGYFVS